ncbi:MAG: hypothetical protein AB1571_00840 [Nanoarchaeota archaeon]
MNKEIIPYILIVAIALTLTYSMFAPGFMLYTDNPTHIASVHFLVDNLLKEQKWITGWSNWDFLGFPMLLYTYQLSYLLIAFLSLFLSVNLAYKIIILFSIIFPSIALYILLKTKYKIIPAAIASILFLLARPILSHQLVGMYNEFISIGFFILFVYFLQKDYSAKNSIILAVLFFLIVISHPYSIFILLYFSLILLFVYRKEVNFIKNYLKISGIGLLLSSYYLLPIILTSSWLVKFGWPIGPSLISTFIHLVYQILFSVPSYFTIYDFIKASLSFNLIAIKYLAEIILASLPQLLTAVLASIGLYYYKKNDKFLSLVLLFSIASFILGTGFWYYLPLIKNIDLLQGIVSYKFIYYGRIGLAVFAAYALSKIKLKKIKYLLFIPAFLLLISGSFGYLVEKDWLATSENSLYMNEVNYIQDWIKNNINGSETRVIYQHLAGNFRQNSVLDTSSVFAMSSYFTNVPSIGIWSGGIPYPTENLRSTENQRLLGSGVQNITDKELIEKMKLVNAKYIVAVEKNLKNKLRNDKFIEKINTTYLSIFELKDYRPEWIETDGTYKLNKFKDNEIGFYIENATYALVKMQYHPYWKAGLDNKTLKINKNENNLMILDVDEMKGNVKLNYSSKNILGIILTLIGLIFIMKIRSKS